jgi:DeoR family transcriptional regulator of aga operon
VNSPSDAPRTQERVRRRRQKLLHIVRLEGATTVGELAARLQCSPMTIRRDLAALQQAGTPVARHQGAVSTPILALERRFQEKMHEAQRAKSVIAEASGSLMTNGQVIGLNGGTTTARLAEWLALHQPGVTVATNALNIALVLTSAGVPVQMVGGTVRPANYETTGWEALDDLKRLHFDWVFLGANGVDPDFGVSTVSAEEAAIGRAFAESADHVAIVADARKLGFRAAHQLYPLRQVDCLITDVEARTKIADWPGVFTPAAHGAALIWRPTSRSH